MNGQSLDAAVLKTLGKVNDKRRSVGQKKMLFVPSKTGLNCNGRVWNCLHDCLCYFEDARNVLQHTCSGTFAGDLLDRTAKVDVEHIGMSLFNNNTCRLSHRLDVFTINLYGNGSFLRADLKLQ